MFASGLAAGRGVAPPWLPTLPGFWLFVSYFIFFLSFYASENIFWSIEGSENAVLSFLSHTFFLAEVMTF